MGVSQLPNIFLTAVGAAFTSIHRLLAGSCPEPCGHCLPACTTHSMCPERVQGPRPGCQRCRAPRDELHDCHFLNKFVLDTPPGSGSLLLWCHSWAGMPGLPAELSWVSISPGSSTMTGALCGTAAAATGSPGKGVSLARRACTSFPFSSPPTQGLPCS